MASLTAEKIEINDIQPGWVVGEHRALAMIPDLKLIFVISWSECHRLLRIVSVELLVVLLKFFSVRYVYSGAFGVNWEKMADKNEHLFFF